MKVVFIKKNTLLKMILWIFIIFIVINIGYLYHQKYQLKSGFSSCEIQAAKGLNNYIINAKLDINSMKLDAQQTVKYINNEHVQLNKLCFHIYPNAYRHQQTAPFEQEYFSQAYPNGFNPGYITIQHVKTNGREVKYSLTGEADTILEIYLEDGILPGEQIDIYIAYQIVLPNSLGRFGYGNFTINLTNWYPILCVYDNSGWNTHPYFEIGDPFYSDAANYSVTITAPSSYIIACTGRITDKSEKDCLTTWKIDALAVRDFTLIASDQFNISKTKVENTHVYCYHINSDLAENALKYAADAISVFSRLFGDYPYSQFSVVQSDFFIGGMEYPNLVMIDKNLYNYASKFFLEYVIVHETAHQWWYGIIGNNEVKEAWLDESLTEYSTIMYFEHIYGEQMKDKVFKSMIIDKYEKFKRHNKGQDETILKSVNEFEDMEYYDSLVYAKGAIMLDNLRKKVGDDIFIQIMKSYYKNNMFGISNTQQFIDVCEKVSGENLQDFFKQWLLDN